MRRAMVQVLHLMHTQHCFLFSSGPRMHHRFDTNLHLEFSDGWTNVRLQEVSHFAEPTQTPDTYTWTAKAEGAASKTFRQAAWTIP